MTLLQFLNWRILVSKLTSISVDGIMDINPQEIVIVSDLEYLKRIFSYFINLHPRTQSDYFYTRIYDSLRYAILEDHKKWDLFIDGVSFVSNSVTVVYGE
ncbi:hypothetical protein BsWGS_17235 [Bradybaena similaris]